MASQSYFYAVSSWNAIPLNTKADSLTAYLNVASTLLDLCTQVHVFWNDLRLMWLIFFSHLRALSFSVVGKKNLLPIAYPLLRSFINNSDRVQVKVMTAKLCAIFPSHRSKRCFYRNRTYSFRSSYRLSRHSFLYLPLFFLFPSVLLSITFVFSLQRGTVGSAFSPQTPSASIYESQHIERQSECTLLARLR